MPPLPEADTNDLVRGGLKASIERLRAMPRPATIEPIDPIELPDRIWD
jgi:hypothetical protein